MTTGEVARRLGVSTSTVRKWADLFSDFLSAEAKPGHGGVREFTPDDLRVLSAVAYYRKQTRLSYEEIEGRLRRGEYPPSLAPETPSPDETAHPSPPSGATDLEPVRSELRELREALRALEASLNARLDALEQQLRSAEPSPEYTDVLRQHLEALHALQHQIDEIRNVLITREQIQALQERLQQEMDLLQALPERLDPAREALAIRERLQRLGEQLHQRLEVIQVQDDFNAQRQVNRLKELQQHLALLQDTVASKEQLREWAGELQRLWNALGNLAQRLENLDEMLATREQVARLHVELERQWELLRTLQELPEQVGTLRTEFAEFRGEFQKRRGSPRQSGGVTRALVWGLQAFSWGVLLVAALGALYYLGLDVRMTVLLAVLVTSGLWGISRWVLR